MNPIKKIKQRIKGWKNLLWYGAKEPPKKFRRIEVKLNKYNTGKYCIQIIEYWNDGYWYCDDEKKSYWLIVSSNTGHYSLIENLEKCTFFETYEEAMYHTEKVNEISETMAKEK